MSAPVVVAQPRARAAAISGVTTGWVMTQPTNWAATSLSACKGSGSVSFMPTGVALSTMSKPVGSVLPWVTGQSPRPARRSTSVVRRVASSS